MGGQEKKLAQESPIANSLYEVCLQGIMVGVFIILDSRDVCFDDYEILLLVMPSSLAMQARA